MIGRCERRRRGSVTPDGAQITPAMAALAWSVLNSPGDASECGRALAQLVFAAAEAGPAGPGRP